MKRKQALAILLSAVLSFTSCTPLGMMTVSASENDESVVIEAEQDGGQEIVSGDEADTAVGEDFSVQETASDAGTFVVSDPIDATVDPEQGDIGQESSDETVIEGGDEAGDASADENEGLSSVPEIVPDGTEAGAGDETAVIPAEQDVFSDDTGVSTDLLLLIGKFQPPRSRGSTIILLILRTVTQTIPQLPEMYLLT